MQIYPEVTTQKILLVGHSQGTFYTNEMYKYLVTHGVSPQSIAVYNIATPASFVAGGGQYVTSANDKVINAVRDAEVGGNVQVNANTDYLYRTSVVASALRANITIPKEDSWADDAYGGHHFSVYMDGAGDRIVNDIDTELARLKATDSSGRVDGCFTPPQPTVGYKAAQVLFGAGDMLANASVSLGQGPIQGSLTLLGSTRGLLTDVVPSFLDGLASALGAQSGEKQAAASVLAVHPNLIAAPSQSQTSKPAAPVQEAPPASPPEQIHTVEQSPAPTPPPAPPQPPAPQQPLFAVAPGFGGGGGGGAAVETPSVAPTAVPLSVTSPADGVYIATTSVIFSGMSDSGAFVSATWNSQTSTTTADTTGNWSLPFTFPEGAQTLAFSAVDSSGNSSVSVSRTITVDTTPPAAPTIAAPDCSSSLSQSHCLLPATSTSIQWNDVAGAVSYAVWQNGSLGTAFSTTSTAVTLLAGATTTVAVVAYDAAGNSATSSGLTVSSFTQPVLINEIAWAGDSTDGSHQWIELKNISGETIDLSRLRIIRSGGSDIPLSGTLSYSPFPFVVVESTSIANTGSPKIITPFSALATGPAEQLSLEWNDVTLDTTPTAATCPGWCAGKAAAAIGRNESGVGDLISPLSMERTTGATDGALASSWHDTDSYPAWLYGANFGQVWGTPDNENSIGLPDAGVYCGSASNLAHANQPFNLPGDCVYLMRFITGSTFGVSREGELYRGTVGSSTIVTGHAFGHALAAQSGDALPADAQAGEDFFFAIYENRSFGSDVTDFKNFFRQGASTTLGYTTPHGNYVTIPWTYQP